jgi:hypothetical protein
MFVCREEFTKPGRECTNEFSSRHSVDEKVYQLRLLMRVLSAIPTATSFRERVAPAV